MYDNFIATPIGDIYFKSSELEEIYISNAHNRRKTFNIEFADQKQFNEFIDLYDWEKITACITPNGYFMKIKLSDSYYGEPVFKIYTIYD